MDDERAPSTAVVRETPGQHDEPPAAEPAIESSDVQADEALDRFVASFNDIDRARLDLDELAEEVWLADDAEAGDGASDEDEDEDGPSRLEIVATFVASLAVLALTIAAALIIALAVGDRGPASANVEAARSGAIVGDAGAPLTIEVWADFQCPYCAEFNRAMLGSIVPELVVPGTARLVYRDFAFLGPESVTAATAARCAGAQGHYVRYHDLLFTLQQGENEGRFSSGLLIEAAGFVGIDQSKFSSCMNDPAVQQLVQDDTAAGRSVGIGSTPTLRLIGPAGAINIPALQPWEAIANAIDKVNGRVPMDTPAASGPPGASQAPAIPPPTPAP